MWYNQDISSAKAEIYSTIISFWSVFEWQLDMKKKDLCAAAGISHTSMAKLGKNENVTTDVLLKICHALNCDIGDIMEIISDNKVE